MIYVILISLIVSVVLIARIRKIQKGMGRFDYYTDETKLNNMIGFAIIAVLLVVVGLIELLN